MTAEARAVWFVVPEGIEDPARVSGGNVFDARVAAELRRRGWIVHVVEAPPQAAAAALGRIAPGGLALIDGLVALGAPDAIDDAADQLTVVLLIHMVAGAFPDADPRTVEAERRVLARARRVVVTSAWARDELVARGLVSAEIVTVATPGSDDAPPATGTPAGTAMLCLGVVAPHKGQDTLIDALVGLPTGQWTCTIVGSLTADPGFARGIMARAAAGGVSERITWTGVLDRDRLAAAYDRADLLVAPSRTESYGIAVGDALRRGIPVVASSVGGIPEAVRPGDAAVLVPPGRSTELRDALQRWIEDPSLRAQLTAAARRTAPTRAGWSDTARCVEAALEGPW